MIKLEVKFKCGCHGTEAIYDDGKGNEAFKRIAQNMICKRCFSAESKNTTEILSVEPIIETECEENAK